MFLDKLPKPFFILAPMDDVTDSVFRQIVADCAKPDLFFTEFVNVDGLQSPGRQKLLHKLQFAPKEQPLIAQLWGLKPENFYKTVKQIRDGSLLEEIEYLKNKQSPERLGLEGVQGTDEQRTKAYSQYSAGAAQSVTQQSVKSSGRATGFASGQGGAAKTLEFGGVDLNMGCPVKAVIKNGACAALINNKTLAGDIIDAVQEAAGQTLPVSVKTRVGFTSVDMSWPEFLLGKKLNMLSIHGRTAKQESATPADWGLIGQVRQMRDALCPATLIVGNGDVASRAQGAELAKQYGLDGIMIGRGIFHDPFIFATQSPWGQWSKEQKLDLFKKHIELHIATYKNKERRFETLRKFCKVYINGFDGAAELRAKFMQTTTAEQALDLLNKN